MKCPWRSEPFSFLSELEGVKAFWWEKRKIISIDEISRKYDNVDHGELWILTTIRTNDHDGGDNPSNLPPLPPKMIFMLFNVTYVTTYH